MPNINTIDELKLGDRVKSNVFTWSQKWMIPGYEEYNMTKIGTIVRLGESFFDTYIIDDENKEILLAVDPGSSGGVSIEKIDN
jgi:hypothetical protein